MLILALSLLVPQNTTLDQKPREQDKPIHLRTELIEIRAVVTDRRGVVVENLKKEDFEVLENDRPQQITFFSLESLDANSSPSLPVAADDSSQLTSNSTTKRTIALFVATVHLSDESFLRAKLSLRDFIDRQMHDGDLVAIISSGGPMGLFNQFTRNRRVLHYAVEKLRPWGVSRSKFTPHLAYLVSRDPDPGNPRGPTNAAIEILRGEEGSTGNQNIRALQRDVQLRARNILSEAARWRGTTLRTLEATMDRMAELAGQKMIFYISDGFTLQNNAGTAHSELEQVTGRAARSGILVYSIAAAGLDADPTMNDASSKVVITPDIHRYLSDSYKEQQDASNALAKDTGGDAFFNSNDIGDSIKKALHANIVYYALAYYIPIENRDPKYRRLSVRIKNHPEYRVRTQKGYLFTLGKTEEETKHETPQQTVMKAITAPLPQTTIGVTATAYYIERDVDNSQVSVGIFIDGTTLNYVKEGDANAIDCELTSVIFDSTGKSTQVVTDELRASLSAAQLEEAKRNGYRQFKRFSMRPGVYEIRVAVREKTSQRIGTANALVEVPNLDRVKLALSSIVLATVPEALPGHNNNNTRIELYPPEMRQGIASFKQGMSLAYQCTVYERSGQKPEALGLLIQSEVTEEGHSVFSSEWQAVSERIIHLGTKGFDIAGMINLDLKPGVYELRLKVRDPKLNRLIMQEVIFEIEA